jgi:hypothetical protein
LDLVEATRIFTDDLKGIGSEVINDFFGVRFSDAVDKATAEVFTNAMDGGRELRFELGDFELIAVLGVARPFAA